MKNVLLIFMLLFVGAYANAQDSFQKKTIKILPASELNITGDTNINSFECVFNTATLKKKQTVQYSGTPSHLKFKDAILALETKGFDCGNKKINKDFHDLVQSDKHPRIFLELREVKTDAHNLAIASTLITIAGTTKEYKLPVEIIEGEFSRYNGKLELNINDFNLEPPKKLFGMIVVKDEIEINFNLVVEKEK